MDHADQIQRVQPHGPYHLAGWSFGGLCAHALAAEFQRRGETVALIAVLDVIPDWQGLTHADVPAPDDRVMLLYHVGLVDDGSHHDDEEMTFARAREILRRQGSVLANLEEDRLTTITEISANNTHLTVDYRPGPVDGDLLLIACSEEQDPPVTAGASAAARARLRRGPCGARRPRVDADLARTRWPRSAASSRPSSTNSPATSDLRGPPTRNPPSAVREDRHPRTGH